MRIFGDRARRLPLLLAGIVTLLVINTILSATRYLALESTYRVPFDESPVWATSALEVELARFLVTLDSFTNDNGSTTREQVQERFDVAWSRLNLFSAGVNARWLETRPDQKTELKRVQDALERLDPLIETIRPGDPVPLRVARQFLLPRMPFIMRMTSTSLQEEVEDRSRLGQVQEELRSEIKIFAASALAAFIGLMIYLIRAESDARASVRKISEAQAAAEAARNRLQEAIANINEGFVLFDSEDRLVLSNEKYREYYSRSADSIRPGETFEAMLRAGIANGQYEEAKADPETFVRRRLTLRRILGDPFEQRLGDGRWLMISDRRTSEGGLVGIRTDITEIKRREAELEDAKTRLQRQAQELRLLAERAERANAAKSEFLATLSHEIRTPMNAVVGLSDLLAGSQLDPHAERYVAAINDAASQLLHLINTILDLSRLEAGRTELDVEAFDLTDMMHRLVGVATALAASKPVQVTGTMHDDLPRVARGDQGRLYQVLLNLLANSVKFTTAGTVALSAGPSDRGGDWIRFTVADTGPGLPERVMDRLFEPFVRGEATVAERAAGTGLGLAISRRFVDLMGGSIGVAETSGHGTVFFVEIRLEEADPASLPRSDAPAVAATSRRLHVLVAEDTPSSRLVVQAMLEKLGHVATCVENGQEAVEAVRREDYDVVIMDMQMPVMDGIEATRQIRRLPGDRGTLPIVFLTAQALPEARRDALGAGTSHYLTKPARLADLRAKLAEIVGGPDDDAAAPGSAMADATTAPAGERERIARAMAPALAELEEALDPPALARILAHFHADAVERLADVERGCDTGDPGLVRKEAHRLAGILGQVGLADLAAAARHLSHDLDADPIPPARRLVADCRPVLPLIAEAASTALRAPASLGSAAE